MATILLIAIVSIVISVLPLCISPRISIASLPYRMFLVLLSSAALLFSGFGFLATFEPNDASMTPWRIGYACIGLVSAGGCGYLLIVTLKELLRRKSQAKPSGEGNSSAQNRPR